jgi:hypothetical protein
LNVKKQNLVSINNTKVVNGDQSKIDEGMASSCSADNDLNQSNANSAAVKRMGKWTECGATGWGADKPFSNISESVIAKNVTQTVCFIKICFCHKKNSNKIELYFCD